MTIYNILEKQMTSLNIVELIEKNPITRISNTYQNKLLINIKEKFTDKEQHIFIASFYCYLNYNQQSDFVIDLDNVWKWLEFSTKQKAKILLEKHFIVDKDYILSLNQPVKQSIHIKGGHNKEIIMLTIRTFKLFCLKAGTKKAEEIHEYYIKLEDSLQEVIQEESAEIKLQLEKKNMELEKKNMELREKNIEIREKNIEIEEKNIEIENQIITTSREKDKLREKTLLEQFPNNTQCVYYGIIDNVNDKNEKLIKFGNSNNLKNRVSHHRSTYLNFCLINAFKVDNKFQIEDAMKINPLFNERQVTLTIKKKKYIELLNITGLSYRDIDKIIKEIITGIEYSPENYIKLLKENKLLKIELENKNDINSEANCLIARSENKHLKIENLKLIKKISTLTNKITNSDSEYIYKTENIILIADENRQLKRENYNITEKYNTIKKNPNIIDNNFEHQELVKELNNEKLENSRLNIENLKLKNYNNTLINKEIRDENEKIQENNIIINTKLENYRTIANISIKPIKQINGNYNINEKNYELLLGTREEVWNDKAYKTTGGLLKHNLMLNKLGKIVSVTKCLQETMNNRLEKCGVNKPRIIKDDI